MRNIIPKLLLIFSLNSTFLFSQECLPAFIPLNQNRVKNANIQKTSDGGYLIAGTEQIGLNYVNQVFLLKIDYAGNTIWKKTIGDTNKHICKLFLQSSDDNYFLLLQNLGKKTHELYKITKDGIEIWKNLDLLISKQGTIENLIENINGELILVGSVRYNSDNPIYIQKLNANGIMVKEKFNYYFNKIISNQGMPKVLEIGKEAIANRINLDISNNFLISCMEILAYTNVSAVGYNFILNIDSNLDVNWCSLNNNETEDIFYYLHQKKDSTILAIYKDFGFGFDGYNGGELYIDIVFKNDSFTKLNLQNICSIGTLDIIPQINDQLLIVGDWGMIKLDSNNKIISKTTFRKSGIQYSCVGPNCIVIDGKDSCTLISIYNGDLFMIRYSYFGDDCLAKLSGTVYLDENRNCTRDTNEKGIMSYFKVFPSDCGYIYSDSSGYYEMELPFGENAIQVPLISFWKEGCQGKIKDTLTFSYPLDKNRSYNIGLFKQDTCFLIDKKIDYFGVKPCSIWTFNYNICTGGDTTIKNINLLISSSKSILNITSNYSYNTSGDTLSFNFDSLKRPDCIRLVLQDSVSCNLKPGDTICYITKLQFKKPCDTIDQLYIDTICRIVRNSHDPNFVEGYIQNQFRCYPEKQYQVPIHYTIHFQNIGNDTAFTVVIRDTLKTQKFDYWSFKQGLSSHPYTFKREQDSILVFEFNNINLLDSLYHEELSKGFVSFEIFGLNSQNDKIKQFNQQVSIYFDSNNPVQTNLDVIASCQGNPTKTKSYSNQERPFIISPNPTSDLLSIEFIDNPITKSSLFIYNSIGQLMTKKMSLEKRNLVQTKSFPNGIYFIRLENKSVWHQTRFIVSH